MLYIKTFLWNGWKRIRDSVLIFIEIEGEQRAASFAYYALFSLVPLFALFLVLGSVIVQPEAVIATAESFFPMELAQQKLVWHMAESLHKSRNGVSLLSLLILIWCSIRFFQVLVQGVNRAWHRIDIPWWKLPLKNLLMMGVLASALGIGIVAPVALQAAGKLFLALEELVHDQVPTMKFHVIALILSAGRYLVAGGLTFYALSALYVLAPGRKIFFKQIWGAALMVTLALQIGQGLFGNYVTKIVNYNAIYGPFGALMLALMWVYIAGGLILLGACFCAAAEQGELEEETIPSSSEN